MLVEGNSLFNPKSIKEFKNLYLTQTVETSRIILDINARRLIEHDNSFAFWTSIEQDIGGWAGICMNGKGTIKMILKH